MIITVNSKTCNNKLFYHFKISDCENVNYHTILCQNDINDEKNKMYLDVDEMIEMTVNNDHYYYFNTVSPISHTLCSCLDNNNIITIIKRKTYQFAYTLDANISKKINCSKFHYALPYYRKVNIVVDDFDRIHTISTNDDFKMITKDFIFAHKLILQNCDIEMMKDVFDINDCNTETMINNYFNSNLPCDLNLFIILIQEHPLYNIIFKHLVNKSCNRDLYYLIDYARTNEDFISIINKNPYCIRNIVNPSKELCLLAYNLKSNSIYKLDNLNDYYDDIVKMAIDYRSYDVTTLLQLTNEHQQLFMDRCKYNIMLLNNPTTEILNNISLDNECKIYYDMYHTNISQYKINVTNKMMKNISKILYEDVMKVLYDCGGYISGSVATNVIKNTKFKCSDIDIYFNSYAQANIFGKYINDNHGYKTLYDLKYNSYSILGTQITNIITHCKREKVNIQLIVINEKISIVNYVMTYFDINFCKNLISGDYKCYTSLESDSKISQHIFNVFELYKFNITMLKNNMIETDINMKNYYINIRTSMIHYLHKVSQRVCKYTLRNIYFDNANIEKFKKEINNIKEILDIKN